MSTPAAGTDRFCSTRLLSLGKRHIPPCCLDSSKSVLQHETLYLGEKRIRIRTSVLEEKATACNMLCCYADELKEGFFPYVEEVGQELCARPLACARCMANRAARPSRVHRRRSRLNLHCQNARAAQHNGPARVMKDIQLILSCCMVELCRDGMQSPVCTPGLRGYQSLPCCSV